MKTITQTFISFVALLILPMALFAQAKSITGDEYNAALGEAESKTEKQIRKRVQIQRFITNGKITHTLTGTSEYLPPNKSRWVYVEDKENGVERIEQVTVGDFTYRKEDNGEWIKQRKDNNFGMGPGGLGGSTSEFFVEEAKIGKEKFRVLVVKTVNLDKTRFEEDKTWINKKGLITKEASSTSLREIKNIISTVDVAYDYKIKPPKIEPPIK